MPPLNETLKSNIKINSSDLQIVRSVKVIICEEATTPLGAALTYVDSILKESMKNQKPFCGKVISFRSDFKRTLSVAKHESRTKIVEVRS